MHFKKLEYLHEFKFIFEKALALNQGPRMDVLMEKTEGRKSDTVPLRCRGESRLFDTVLTFKSASYMHSIQDQQIQTYSVAKKCDEVQCSYSIIPVLQCMRCVTKQTELLK
jgi:hypothetical protein